MLVIVPILQPFSKFGTLWHKMATRLGIETEFLATDWRRGVDPQQIEDRLRRDMDQRIKAVCVVHNETSTGSTSRIGDVRLAMDNAGHTALLLVDTISSLGSIDYRHDEWGMLPLLFRANASAWSVI